MICQRLAKVFTEIGDLGIDVLHADRRVEPMLI